MQAADKGGAIVAMEKDWHKDKIKEQKEGHCDTGSG